MAATIEQVEQPNRLRCNNAVGFVKGNKKGYCKKRGVVAKIVNFPGRPNPVFLCQDCYQQWRHPKECT